MRRTVQSEQKTRSFQTALDLTTDAKINVSGSETESSCFTHSWTEFGDDGVMPRPRKTVQWTQMNKIRIWQLWKHDDHSAAC